MDLVRENDLPLWAYSKEEVKDMCVDMVKWTAKGRFTDINRFSDRIFKMLGVML
jgi:acetone carboxylase gamma subunit